MGHWELLELPLWPGSPAQDRKVPSRSQENHRRLLNGMVAAGPEMPVVQVAAKLCCDTLGDVPVLCVLCLET